MYQENSHYRKTTQSVYNFDTRTFIYQLLFHEYLFNSFLTSLFIGFSKRQ